MRIKYLQSLHRNFPNKLFCTEILQLMQQIKPSFRTPFTMVISPSFFFFFWIIRWQQLKRKKKHRLQTCGWKTNIQDCLSILSDRLVLARSYWSLDWVKSRFFKLLQLLKQISPAHRLNHGELSGKKGSG